MSKTLFLGDCHSDFLTLERFAFFALERWSNINRIVQVGDFGLYPDFSIAYWYQKSSLPIPVEFIDGNHEDFRFLSQGIRCPYRPSPLYDAVYLPRGYSRDGFLYMGGATSIDRKYRKPGFDWFEAENITTDDLEAALASIRRNPIHTIVAHETTEGAFPLVKKPHWSMGDANRIFLETIFQAAKPRTYVHGHLHFHATYKHHGCTFVCLQNLDHFRYQVQSATHAELLDYSRKCSLVVEEDGSIVPW
jgi:hypothetical protein